MVLEGRRYRSAVHPCSAPLPPALRWTFLGSLAREARCDSPAPTVF